MSSKCKDCKHRETWCPTGKNLTESAEIYFCPSYEEKADKEEK